MKAAVFKGAGKPLSIESVKDPTPGSNQVVIEVKRCGICGTDLHGTEDHEGALAIGTVPGHEYVGEIVAAGSKVDSKWKTGSKVTGIPFHLRRLHSVSPRSPLAMRKNQHCWNARTGWICRLCVR